MPWITLVTALSVVGILGTIQIVFILQQRKLRRLHKALTTLLNRGKEVFEDEKKFHSWLDTPNKALGEVKPMSLTDTPENIDKLLTILGRIEYGVYS